MDTNKLVEQPMRDPASLKVLSELPDATAEAVIEHLKKEADRHGETDPNRALAMAGLIIVIGQARANPRQLALGMLARGDALRLLGRVDEASEAFELARNILLAAGDDEDREHAPIPSLSLLLAQRNANLQAQARVEAESDSAISLQRLLLRIDSRIADVYKQIGDHRQAAHHYQTALATAETLGETGKQFLPNLYMKLAFTYIALGDAPQALTNLEHARRILSIAGNQKLETLSCHNARKSLKDMLLGGALESDELQQAEAHVVTCPFCQLRLQLLAMEILMEPEGTCSVWRDQLHEYVEAQLAGHDDDHKFVDLRHHLDACEDCAEAYALLYETMWAEQQSIIPEPSTMPTLDTSFLSSKAAADPSQHGLPDRLRNAYQTDDPSYRMRARSQLNVYMQQNPQRKREFLVFWRFSIAFATVMMLFLASGTAFAQQALPGDALYNWKLTSEHIWRFTSIDQLGYDIVLSNRRMHELLAVSRDETRRASAIQNYERLLIKFSNVADEDDRVRILLVLRAQHQALLEAGVIVPELEPYFPR